MDTTTQFLKSLTEANGVPGYETEVRAFIRQQFELLGEVSQDHLGSVICQQGQTGPKVMVAGHMDEIGFMVRYITEDGFLKFLPLGGWWDQVLLGHRVTIKTHKGNITGVLGAKPPHLLKPEERSKVVEKEQMYIDIGVSSQKEASELGVRVGDPVIPQSDFQILANGKSYVAKAFDNRIGCAVAIELLRHFATTGETAPNQRFGVATVMEEVGVRGATTSVAAIKPDVAIVLESDIAGDVPGIKKEESVVKLGAGPTLSLFDARMIPNLKLRNLVIETAEAHQIPLQFSVMTGGATDGAAIHLYGTGVPTVVIGVPTRHIHSHNSIIHRDDYDQTVKLVVELVKRLDESTIKALTIDYS